MTVRIYRILAVAAFAAGAAVSASHAATVTPGFAAIGLTAHAGLNRDISTVATQQADQISPLQPLSANVLASVEDAGRSLSTGAHMAATFLSAAHGRVVISDAGWRGQNVAQGLYAHASLRSSAGFSYDFSISAPARLSVSFAITADPTSTELFGLQGFKLRDLGNGVTGEMVTNVNDPTVLRRITRDLLPGTYTLGLGIEPNIAGLPGSRISLMDAIVEWSIGDVDWTAAPIEATPVTAPVPLPPAFALMGTALMSVFLLGVARRATRFRAPLATPENDR